jgi:hypothetical protein
MKNKKEKKATVVPEKNVGASNVVTKEKFDFKKKLKDFLVVIKKGLVKLGSLIKKGFTKLVELVKAHKKVSAGVAAALVIVIGCLFVIPSLSKPSTEKVIKQKVNDLGVTFYEDFYYKSSGNGDNDKRTEFLSKYQSMGIKVSLENLIRYYVTTDKYKELDIANVDASVTDRVEALKKAWFEDKNYNCDGDNTKVIIYPKDPFGEKDYKTELVTVCGFKDEEESDETTTKKKETNTVTQKATETTTKATTKATKKTTKKK